MSRSIKWLTVVALYSAVNVPVFAANPNEFLVYNFDRYGNGLEQNSNDLPGRLFIPASYNPATPMPVVVFYHGLGERGSVDAADGTWNVAQVNSNMDNLLAAAKARGFILYCPQAWGGWGNDNLENSVNQITKLTTQYNVDKSKIFATGLSLGGGGVMTVVSNYPQVFSGAVDICGSPTEGTEVAARQINTPLWIHHGTADSTVNISVSRNRVNAIRAAKGLSALTFPVSGNFYDDGTLRYTEYPGQEHGIWSNVLAQPGLYNWMLAQAHTIPALAVGQTIKFDIGGTENTSLVNGHQDLLHTNNLANTALFTNVHADAGGNIDIRVPYGFVNWISLTTTSIPEPSVATLPLGVLGGVMLLRRRWGADRAC